jgi:hypothetical protein
MLVDRVMTSTLVNFSTDGMSKIDILSPASNLCVMSDEQKNAQVHSSYKF